MHKKKEVNGWHITQKTDSLIDKNIATTISIRLKKGLHEEVAFNLFSVQILQNYVIVPLLLCRLLVQDPPVFPRNQQEIRLNCAYESNVMERLRRRTNVDA